MPLFRRKKDNPPDVDEPLEHIEIAPGVTLLPNGDITLKIGSIPAAKLAIKQLQLTKKEYAAEKRLVATKVSEAQAARRNQIAQQGSKMRGAGKLGRAVRDLQTEARDQQRRQHTAALTPLEDMKRDLERRSIVVDKAITKLQQFILENAENE